MLSLRILGPIECRRDNELVDLGGNRPKLIMALLAVDRGRVVGRDRIIDAIWATDPPESAPTQVAIHISSLRKALGDADVIETVDTGYRIRPDAVWVDAHEARDLIAEARATQRTDLFRRALSLWDGPQIAGISHPAITPAAQRVEGLRLDAIDDWAALALDRGEERDLLEVLPHVVDEHPLRESVRARLIEALWRCDRRADALNLYDDGVRVLADELGIDPGAELVRLRRQILQEETEPPTTSAPPAIAPAYAPRQLPVDVGHFTGRGDELAALDRIVEDGRPGRIVALHGLGGGGKSTLAVHWAHRHADRFPDGQLFVNLMGHGPGDPLPAVAALEALLRQLGIPAPQIPASEDDRARLMRGALADRRVLLILDNARDSVQVRPLLPGGDSVVIVTSRSQLRGLATREAAQRVAVNQMPEADAVELLLSRKAPTQGSGTPWDRSDLTDLARLCGNLPVALAVAAERANRYVDTPLADLTAELRDSRAALDTLTAWQDDPASSVRAVLTWSFDALDAETMRLFRLLGLHPYPSLDVTTAGALAAQDLVSTRSLLDRLTDCHLLAEPRPGRYELHDLVRAFAADLAATALSDDERDEALDRMRGCYIHSAESARASLQGTASLLLAIDSVPAGVEPIAFDNVGSAMAWFTANKNRLTSVVNHAADTDDHPAAYRLAGLMQILMNAWGWLDEEAELISTAEQSARLAGDRAAEAFCIDSRGEIHWRAGRHEEALDHFVRARDLSGQIGDERGEVHPLMCQGLALRDLGQVEAAVATLEDALALARRVDTGVPSVLNNLAAIYITAGRCEDAITAAEESARLRRDAGNAYHEAIATDTFAMAHAELGSHERARDAFLRCVALHERVGDNIYAAGTLRRLGLSQAALGETEHADESWRRALRMMDDLDAPDNNQLNRAEVLGFLRENGARDQAPPADGSSRRSRPSAGPARRRER